MSFEVGQKVVMFDSLRGDRLSTVVRVTKRFIETKGGSRWNLHGHPYPRQDCPTYSSIVLPMDTVSATTIDRVRREMHARSLAQVDWASVPLETLRKIGELVKEAKSA